MKFGIGILTFITGLFGGHAAGNFNPTGGGTYLLQASISASQSTITLTSFQEPGSNIPYTMSYINTDIIYGTIAPSSGSSEFVSASGITQNANGTATLTGVVRGLSRTPGTGGCVASTTLARAFPGQTQFILSNSPCFYSEYLPRRTNATSTAVLAFASTTPPHYDWNPLPSTWTILASTTLASKGYVDDTVTAGCASASTLVKGCVEIATQIEAASSTSSGGTGALLVLPASMATSSPYTTGLWSVITMNDGKISPNFMATSSLYTYRPTANFYFGSGFVSQASTTFAATSTFAATTTFIGDVQGIFPQATSTTYATAGSFTWARPAGVNRVKVTLVGGGGGSGGGTAQTAGGGGGGSGAYCVATVKVTGNVSVTVGAAGASGGASGDGGNGGDSTFAGAVTITAAKGNGGAQGVNASTAAGGAGGSCTNANVISVSGESGGTGNDGTPTFGGTGGSNPLGHGGGNIMITSTTGSGFGSGASGGVNASGTTGNAGIVIIEWMQSTPYYTNQ